MFYRLANTRQELAVSRYGERQPPNKQRFLHACKQRRLAKNKVKVIKGCIVIISPRRTSSASQEEAVSGEGE